MPYLRAIDDVIQPMSGQGGTPSLKVAQLNQLRRQLPWLYALLMITTGAMTLTHFHRAPLVLTVVIPAAVGSVALWRMVYWLLPLRPHMLTEDGAVRALNRVMIAGTALAFAFVIWAIMLDGYNDNPYHGNISIYAGITLLGCLFCLMHMPRAGQLVAITVCVPFTGYGLWTGHLSTISAAINLSLVAAVIVRVVNEAHGSFNALIISRYELAAKHSETKRLSDENRQLAHTDALTGLPNRRRFFQRLDELLGERRGGSETPFAIGVLDLDRFKPINDTFGHAVGDRLLSAIGARFAAFAHDRLLVARLGGDEFGVIVDGSGQEAERIIDRMCRDIQQPIAIGDLTLKIGCSGGIAMFPDSGTTAHDLFDRSDFALFHVKAHQRGGCAIFAREHEEVARGEQEIESALCAADLEAEIGIAFQPIFCMREMTVSAVEALARWNSPVLGRVPPARLIAAAERLGMMNRITLLLFEKALAAFERLPASIDLNFNLSAADIASEATARAIIGRIVATRLPFERFVFEVTETSLIRDVTGAQRVLGKLRALGGRVALDDFGTGYSSLGTLHQLPLDIVKVDRSFTLGIDSASGRKIVAAIRTLAQSLGLQCIIEGIETEAQFMESALIGYRQAQGYLLGRPMTVDELLRILPDCATELPIPNAAPLRSRA